MDYKFALFFIDLSSEQTEIELASAIALYIDICAIEIDYLLC